jgi:hypothetical protein
MAALGAQGDGGMRRPGGGGRGIGVEAKAVKAEAPAGAVLVTAELLMGGTPQLTGEAPHDRG